MMQTLQIVEGWSWRWKQPKATAPHVVECPLPLSRLGSGDPCLGDLCNAQIQIHKNKYLDWHFVTNVDAQICIHKYTNRIASIEIWGPVPASATHADAQIHNIDTQLKYTNSKVQIIRLESGDPCLRPRCIFTNTLICPRANTNRNDHTVGDLLNDQS